MAKKTITINPKRAKGKVRPPSARQREVILGEGGPTEAGWHNAFPFLRCLKAGQLEVVRGVTVPVVQTPSHFAKGILLHAGRARWFSLRFDTSEKAWRKVLAAMEMAAEQDKLPINPKDMQASVALMSAYIEHYSKLPQPDPIAAEYKIGPPPKELVEMDKKGLVLNRTARLDDVSRYPEGGMKLYLGECKTTSGSPQDVLREYELHGQIMTQIALWELCPEGAKKYGPVEGVMLDIIKKPERGAKPVFARIPVRVTRFQMKWFIESMQHHLKIQNAIGWDSEVPRNPTACTYMAGRARVDCTFKDLCRYGGDISGKYIMKDGTSLKAHKPEPGRMKMPWE